VHCPRCETPLTAGRCTRCSYQVENEPKAPGSTVRARREPIKFAISSSRKESDGSIRPDWREELKKRVDEHVGKKEVEESETDQASAENLAQNGTQGSAEGDTGKGRAQKRILFEYRMKEKSKNPGASTREIKESVSAAAKGAPAKVLGSAAKPQDRRIVTFDQKDGNKSDVLEKQLVRRSSPTGTRGVDSRQRKLQLQTPPEIVASSLREAAASVPSSARVSKEILFSRFLSGIIDLSFPVVLGFSFVLAASRLVDFDFFMANSLEWAAVFSLVLYCVGSSFFLLALGQTPGMILTELRLVSDKEGRAVSERQIFLRVALFLPVAATLFGLLWSLFDSRCRTLHDRFTGTRVEPAN
jgi:uncharacterized RDD family membrane protein YckC